MISKAKTKFENGQRYQLSLSTVDCTCLFFNQYMLPCKHIFYEDICCQEGQKFITDDDWEAFAQGWEESGYDIYESKEQVSVMVPYQESTVGDVMFKEELEMITEAFYKYPMSDRDSAHEIIRKAVRELELDYENKEKERQKASKVKGKKKKTWF